MMHGTQRQFRCVIGALVELILCCGLLMASAKERQVEVRFEAPQTDHSGLEWSRLSASWHFRPDASVLTDFRGPYGGSVLPDKRGRAVVDLHVPGTLRVEVAPSATVPVRGKAEIAVSPQQFDLAERTVMTVPLESVEWATVVVTLLDGGCPNGS